MMTKTYVERQDKNGTYLEGVLKGQTSLNVLISAEETQWLKHASEETGYSLERLVQISVEEAALKYARNEGLVSDD
jgi:hypothetical protein